VAIDAALIVEQLSPFKDEMGWAVCPIAFTRILSCKESSKSTRQSFIAAYHTYNRLGVCS
jgi:hypothetical protein